MQTAVPAPFPTAALSALRAATRAQHHRIDRTMDLASLHERSRYVRVLQVFDAFLAAWEPLVARALPQRQAWLQVRSRRGFVQRDLRALGAAPGTPCDVALPEGAAAAWGSLYVLEGSALGGQMISRALAAHGLGPDSGGAYFHGFGDATPAMWREFRQLLESQLDSPAATAAACDAARGTFDTLTTALETALHECTSAA